MPTDWTVPEPTAMYVRASIVEQLPDPLSPLFADMIDGAVTRSLQSLFREFLGSEDCDRGRRRRRIPTVNELRLLPLQTIPAWRRLMWKSRRPFGCC